MPKKTIAVDVDDVLAINVESFVKFSNKNFGTTLTAESYDENWLKVWGISIEELRERSSALISGRFWQELNYDPDALDVLKKLSKNYRLIITTSRIRKLNEITKEWINLYFKDIFEDIYHAGIFDDHIRTSDYLKKAVSATKADLVEQLGADYLIDDHPKHCIGAARVGKKALLFGYYPWNRNIKLPDNVVRVKNWQAVGKYFDKQK